MTGSTARRCLLGLVVAVAGLVMAAPASAAPAAGPLNVQRAPNDPPDVHGLNIADTRKVLQSWNKGVVIIFDPDLRKLPQGATEENVVASRDTLVTQSTQTPQEFAAANGPRVLVTLGAVMPDLKGLGPSQAQTVLANRGLTLDPTPDRPPSAWVVTGQAYPPGSVVEFSAPVPAAFGPPAAPPPPPPPPGPKVSLPVAIAIGAGALLLLVLLTTLLVRSARRSRTKKRNKDHSHKPERIEVHAFAGQVIGPDVFDLPGAPPVASVPPPREVRS
jgi:hypothetical protein